MSISGVAMRGAWSLESLLLFKCTSNSEQYQQRATPPSRTSLLLPLTVAWEVGEEDDSSDPKSQEPETSLSSQRLEGPGAHAS